MHKAREFLKRRCNFKYPTEDKNDPPNICGKPAEFVMEFNRPVTGNRQAWIAEAIGIDISSMNEEATAEAAKEAVLSLVKELGLPYRLRDVGVEEEDFEELAADAMQDFIVASNPRGVSSKAEVIELLKQSW